ncbi:alpha/beta fold hydrolase [Streptomyces sp. NPDC001315]|uniref:alpha/beta fold hydrolase n=1 Tax=Streptomyces sp. NPDC001315 TaxID=3364562 RepID=UPI0036776FD7
MVADEEADVVVIGSGMGGLAAARTIAQFGGKRVLVLADECPARGRRRRSHPGTCRVRVLSGAYETDDRGMFSADELAAGRRLACQTLPTEDLVIGGEALLGLQTKYPGSRLSEEALDFRPYGGGLVDGYIKKELFHDVFAGDLPKATAELMWAGQRPADVRTLGEPSGAPAWKTIPSWYLVGRDDQVLPPAAQRFMARRAGAHTFEADASHVAMIAQPAATAAPRADPTEPTKPGGDGDVREVGADDGQPTVVGDRPGCGLPGARPSSPSWWTRRSSGRCWYRPRCACSET